ARSRDRAGPLPGAGGGAALDARPRPPAGRIFPGRGRPPGRAHRHRPPGAGAGGRAVPGVEQPALVRPHRQGGAPRLRGRAAAGGVPQRGARPPPPAPSQHRAALRERRGGRALLPADGVPGRPLALRGAGGHAQAPPARAGRHPRGDERGCGGSLPAPLRLPVPRPEAGQHPPARGRAGAAGLRRGAPHQAHHPPHGPAGDGAVHGSRAGAAGAALPRHRRVRAGGAPLRAAYGEVAERGARGGGRRLLGRRRGLGRRAAPAPGPPRGGPAEGADHARAGGALPATAHPRGAAAPAQRAGPARAGGADPPRSGLGPPRQISDDFRYVSGPRPDAQGPQPPVAGGSAHRAAGGYPVKM
ncbi:MAG: hypothetical protein AVDCRST_MAG68-88, partial [uncultured Gemmatimonadetes bacterium]